MRAFKLWLLAMFLLTAVNITNRVLFKRTIKHLPKAERRKRMAEYDRQEAMALDGFAGFNYRTFFEKYTIKEGGYKYGIFGEMISSVLGKNEHDGTLSGKGTGKLSKWFYGEKLVKVLNKLDPDHCKNSIDLTKGEWIRK